MKFEVSWKKIIVDMDSAFIPAPISTDFLLSADATSI